MKKIHVNFIDYDLENHSLKVTFQADTSDQEYGPILFDIHQYAPDDMEETIRIIAQYGMEIIRDEETKRASRNNVEMADKARNLIGKTAIFDVQQLLRVETTQAGGYTNSYGVSIV
jgi:hypothetical protein